MKVVFLDFDGVLNSERWDRHRAEHSKPDGSRYSLEDLDPACVARAQRVCDVTGAKVVISSDWRRQGDIARLRAILVRNGLTAEVIDVTPVDGVHFGLEISRESEIKAWLDTHPEVTRWVAIDDMTLALDDRLVNTSEEVGLTDADADLAIERLREWCGCGDELRADDREGQICGNCVASARKL